MTSFENSTFFIFRKHLLRRLILGIFLLIIPLIPSFLNAQQLSSGYQAGLVLENQGDINGAIAAWERYLTQTPNAADKEAVWFAIASAAIKLKTDAGTEKAAHYFNLILTQKDAQGKPIKSVFHEQALFRVAQVTAAACDQKYDAGERQIAMGTYPMAKAQLLEFVKEYPNSQYLIEVYPILAKIALIYENNLAEAKDYCEKAFAVFPSPPRPEYQQITGNLQYYYAWILNQMGEQAKALQYYAKIVSTPELMAAPRALYEIANIFFERGEHQKALTELQVYEQRFPNDQTVQKQILHLRALCYFELKQYTQSLQVLDQIEQLRLTDPLDQILRIRCYIEMNNFQTANTLLTTLESQYSSSGYKDALKVLRAHYYYKNKNYRDAITLLVDVLGVQQNQTTGVVTFTRGPMQMSQQQGSTLLNATNQTSLTEQYYLMACGLLSICYAESGDTQTASKIFEAMQRVSNELYGRYAFIREKTQEKIYAAMTNSQQGNQGMASYPNNTTNGTISTTPGSTIWGSGSNSVYQPGSVTNATDMDPDFTLKQCATLLKTGNLDAAYADLNKLLRMQLSTSNKAKAAIMLGELLIRQGDETSAKELFEIAYLAIEQDENNVNKETQEYISALYYMAQYAQEEGKYYDAANYYSKGLGTKLVSESLSQKDMFAYRMGCALLKVRDQKENAIRCFEYLYYDRPMSNYWSHAGLRLALDDFGRSDYVKADETINDLIQKMPAPEILDQVLYLKGEIAREKGQWDVAATAYDTIVSYVKDSRLIASAQKRLNECNGKIVK